MLKLTTVLEPLPAPVKDLRQVRWINPHNLRRPFVHIVRPYSGAENLPAV